MAIRWRKQISMVELLRRGGKCGENIPQQTGVYRIRVLKGNKRYPGNPVIYIGKVGGGKGNDRHLRRRIGEFIIAGLGFEIPHSGGIRFWEQGNNHKLWIQDLEVQYFPSNDPACDEIRAFDEFKKKTGKELPLLNKVKPRMRCLKHSRQKQ